LVWQKSWLFGNRLVSLPTFDTTGVVADDPEAQDLLIARALELASELGAELLLRQLEPLDAAPRARHCPTEAGGGSQVAAGRVGKDKVLIRVELPSDAGALWRSLKAKVRNQVRKPQKQGLSVDRGGEELLEDFYRVYSANMRDLGSPPHSRRFFRAVLEAFRDETTIYVVRLEGRTVGAGFTMANGDRLEIPWASSLRRYNPYCVNHLMYWHILEDACQAGYRWFHFGRSTEGSGQYRFKMQWRAEAVPLHWYCFAPEPKAKKNSRQRCQVPGARCQGPGSTQQAAESGAQAAGVAAIVGTPTPDSCPLTPDGHQSASPPVGRPHITTVQDRYSWATAAWRRLPLWFVRWLGPKIIAKVP